VLNEDAVVDTLREYGFEPYRLADYSVAEQAILFDEADLVVGAHGAGFSNLVYTEDTAVLELFGEKIKPNYANLAKSIGLSYDSLECRPRGVDLQVDTEQLATAVEALLAGT
jgi:capsular polysaccharide biosynthesis protein